MTVVLELDKTLFESYVKPKSAVLVGIVRNGILDTTMDWYETPQPTGLCTLPPLPCPYGTLRRLHQRYVLTCSSCS